MIVRTRAKVRRPVPFRVIANCVVQDLQVIPEELCGSSRSRRAVLARGLIVRLCRELTTLSYPEIAVKMQRPNHSSVITADNRIRVQLENAELRLSVLLEEELEHDHLLAEMYRDLKAGVIAVAETVP